MIITFTDFGADGPYMGQMKARLWELSPQSQIVDLMVDVPAFKIEYGAKLLSGLIEDMPEQAVYLCVVDPGVGGTRKPLCLKCDGRWFVGPDNGLFQDVIANSQKVEPFEILWRPQRLSRSFHGRDLFAPVAAMLETSQPFDKQALNIQDLIRFPTEPEPYIIYIDHYGNCWCSIRHNEIEKSQILHIEGLDISYADVFCDTGQGDVFWYFNSSGFVEIALNQGNAAQNINLKLGTRLKRN
jgi:S-adenosylmethionine hydrolase